MTNNDNTPPDDTIVTPAPGEPDTIPTAPAETADVAALRREAAGRRRALREAEAARDALAARLERLQRAEVERLATTRAEGVRPLVHGDDLWLDGTELAALLDDDGNIDADRVRDKVREIGTQRPHWLDSPGRHAADLDGGKGAAPDIDNSPSFSDALKGARG